MDTFYRIQPADRDPAALLDESAWQSRAWVGMLWKKCPDCVDGAVLDPDFGDEPALVTCGSCGGAAELEDIRNGVSACRSLDTLFTYFASRDADLDDCVVVQLRGEVADDDDHEPQTGAVLVWPRHIMSVTLLDPAKVKAVAE